MSYRKTEENVRFPLGPLLKDPQKTKKTYTFPLVPYWKLRRERAKTCTFPTVPYWKFRRKQRKRALSPRSLTESSAQSELSWLDAHWDSLCGLVLITSSENYGKEGCEKWSALPFWRSHCLDLFWASRFGVIVVYRWMCHEYRKLNQPPSLCSVCLTRVHAPFSKLNVTQPVRTDL